MLWTTCIRTWPKTLKIWFFFVLFSILFCYHTEAGSSVLFNTVMLIVPLSIQIPLDPSPVVYIKHLCSICCRIKNGTRASVRDLRKKQKCWKNCNIQTLYASLITGKSTTIGTEKSSFLSLSSWHQEPWKRMLPHFVSHKTGMADKTQMNRLWHKIPQDWCYFQPDKTGTAIVC